MQKAAAGGLFFCLVPTCHPNNCSACTALETPAIGNLFRAARQVPYNAGVLAYRVGVGYMGTPIFALTKRAVCTEFPSNNPKKNYKPPFYCFTGIAIFARIFLSTEETTEKETKMTSLERLLGQSLGLRTRTRSQASIDSAKKHASDRGKCKRLAAKLGLTIEYDRCYRLNIVDAGPDILEKTGWVTAEKFEEMWPDERMHFDWGYMLTLMREFQSEVEAGGGA
tara:strand:- start:68 stop:739 length:672 start_codon:yes stop_codon:yes gene_type:complete